MRIHAWGGLGSQLFAVAVAKHMLKQYPRRRIKVVLHSGGITKRIPEVITLYPELTFEFVDDFAREGASPHVTKRTRSMRTFLKYFMLKMGVLSEANDDIDLSRVRPWCRALRGHYSYITVEELFIRDLYERLLVQVSRRSEDHKILAIHYRLGDLLNLQEKSFIMPRRLEHALASLGVEIKSQEISLYSDSPEIALNKLESLGAISNLKTYSVSAIETILDCSKSLYFIGTSSKISFWIAGIRDHCFSYNSKLPIENFREYRGLIKSQSKEEIAYL